MTDRIPENPFDNATVIYRYSRAQAIEGGVLIDLTEWASELGFRFPVACTAAVWHGYVVPPEETRQLGQSERGRAHDLLWMLLNAIRSSQGGQSVMFKVIFLQTAGRRRTVKLKSVCGPGDRGEPVITIMMPDED